MIPSLETTVLHYEGLEQVGVRSLGECEECHTRGMWNSYRKRFREGRQGHVGVVCDDCVEAGV